MKALYVAAWIGLLLSVIVHILSLLALENVLSDIDGFLPLLHGGVILLGFATVLCSQKLTLGTQEKDFWKAVFKNCPDWMRTMVGFFFLYGIINFVFIVTKGKAGTSNHGMSISSIKFFSGGWMLVYSMEVVIFYSFLKEKLSDVSKNFRSDLIVPMDVGSPQQSDSSMEHFQTKRYKYSRIVTLFFIVSVVFLILLWLAFKGYPWFLGCTLFSLFPFAVLQLLYLVYSGWRTNAYLKKNHSEIWEKYKSASLANRVESQRLLKELDDPYLKSLTFKATRFSKICFWVWLILIGVVLITLTLL